ncbi:MAG: CRISPR-associated endoribonuclease Cas6 [Atribacterota bacterium]
MRIKISFTTIKDNKIKLPLQYNYILQGFIYTNFKNHFSHLLHDKGYKLDDNKRKFKLFTFSRINSNNSYKIGKNNNIKTITFYDDVYFKISSPIDELIQQFCEKMASQDLFILGNKKFINKLHVKEIAIESPKEFTYEERINLLTPITVYSTLMKADGSKKTYFYKPYEKEFEELIRNNIYKKYKAYYKKLPSENNFQLEYISRNPKDRIGIKYKNFYIEGWRGKYRINSSPELIKFAYDAGLGAKNSQGFGMFEVLK